MNFEILLSFFILGILPVLFYLHSFPKEHPKLKGFILSILFLIFPILVIYFYQKTTLASITNLDIIVGSLITLGFNYLAFTGGIERKKLVKSALTICLFFFGSFIQIIPIKIFNINSTNITPVIENYLTLFSDTFLFVVLALMYYRELKNGIIAFKKNFNRLFETSFKYWLLGFIGMVVSNGLIAVLFPSATPGNEQSVQSMIDVTPFLMLICAGVLAPIIEEITFRQAFKDVFKNGKIFVLVSGIVFGLLHVIFAYTSLIDFIYVIPYSLLGISLAYMVYKTDNICSSILMHMIHNSLIIILSILTGMIIL